MNPPDYPLDLTVAEASQLVKSRPATVRILDVREPFEVEICRIAGAETIPMRQIPEHVATLPRDQYLLILCHHGNRSLRVTQFLRAQGFSAVSNIAGGIDAWAEQLDSAMPRY
jgi:adenylyltransferase/sulfurtransferase